MKLDYDLSSIQQARDLARQAKAAQVLFAEYTEQEIDKVLVAMVEAVKNKSEYLARLAVEETDYGVVEHKVVKNLFASQEVYDFIKSLKTAGVIKEDPERRVIETAVPVGVIVGITPSTNPTSTIIHNSLCAVKGGNAIVFSPHPGAVRCSSAAAQILHDAAVKAGAPEGLIACLTKTSMRASEELMKHEDVSVIIATGGSAMVKAAYSAGKPAFGVGPGNVPVFIERTANIRQAVRDIITSKTFDNGMICASEQSILVDEPIKDLVIAELKSQGAYFLAPEEIKKVTAVVMTPKGGINPPLTGKTATYIAAKAGVKVPANTRMLIAPLEGFGPGYPLSYEKLTSVLAFYTVKDWHDACLLSIELLKLGGIGHSFAIHSQDQKIIREFIKKPVFRILVNTPSAFGGIGYSTGITPSLTIGCGTWGGSSISENLGPQHLINIKRLAFGIRQVDLSNSMPAASTDCELGQDKIADIVQQVLKQLQKQAL